MYTKYDFNAESKYYDFANCHNLFIIVVPWEIPSVLNILIFDTNNFSV